MSVHRNNSRHRGPKRVRAVGKRIGKMAPLTNGKTGRLVAGKRVRVRNDPRVSDIPKTVRTNVADVRARYRKWKGGNAIAAKKIIEICGGKEGKLGLVMRTMLKEPIHKGLKAAIRKQMG